LDLDLLLPEPLEMTMRLPLPLFILFFPEDMFLPFGVLFADDPHPFAKLKRIFPFLLLLLPL